MMEINTIQIYIKDLNEALTAVDNTDILKQFKKLNNLEDKFSRKLKSVAGGKQVYRAFIMFIRKAHGGMKAARQYFREREGSYVETINMAIDKNIPELMHKSKINFQFCKFAINHMASEEKQNQSLTELFENIKTIREEIINRHLHLALHKAKAYKKRSKVGALEFGDLVQISNEGLIMAVDKYVLSEDSAPFHNVAIGRMMAHLIASGTFGSAVTIGGHGNKKLYQIKRLFEKIPGLTAKEAATILDSTLQEVEDLLAASSYFSLDQEIEGSDMRIIDTIAAPADHQNDPYLQVEKADLLATLRDSFRILSIIEKKVLVLKGVKIEDFT